MLGYRAVPSNGGLVAQPHEIAHGRVAIRHVGLRKGVAQVRGQVEPAAFGYLEGIGDRFRAVREKGLHFRARLQVKLVVGQDVLQAAVDGGVVPYGDQGVLKLVPPRCMVESAVRGDQRNPHLPGERSQPPVAARLALEQVPLDLDVHRVRAEPVHSLLQTFPGLAVLSFD